MSTIVNKTKADAYKAGELQKEINASALIVPSCLSITGSGTALAIEFAVAIDGPEDTALDAVILAHAPSTDYIDAATLPFSDVDEGGASKLSVHPSYKPNIADGTTYAVWAGGGDDVVSNPSVLGEGDLLHFDMQTATPIATKDVKFDHAAFGRVWIHEAYLKFSGAGNGDFVSSDIMAGAAVTQTSVNLDLIIDGVFVKPAPGGPGTGTDGWAASPTLIPRTFSQDGDWDFDGVSLTPNLGGTGGYRISNVDTPVHRYVNRIPCYGECPYFSMSSDETAEINAGYFIRINVHNVSDGNWHLSVIMELYRERTVDP